MEDTVYLEWTYKPEDYFESDITIHADGYILEITQGKAVAKMAPEYYFSRENARDQLHQSLESRFLGIQVLTHKPYELSKASMHRIRPNGQRDVTVFPEGCVSTCSVGTIDLIVRDKEGNVVSDSKAERIEKKKAFAELADKYGTTDQLAQTLLNSYKSAVYDPDNELIHLYEIREAISKNYSGEENARAALHINKNEWSSFGVLTNTAPLKQGRHRGKNYESLRNATQDELQECRLFARSLIEKYFNYLESKNR